MKNSTFWHVFSLGALVFIVFSPALSGQFLNWDDYGHYVSNPCVYSLSWTNLVNLFRQTVNNTYIPLTTLSFNLEYHIFGLSAFVSHLINIFLHFGVAWAIYLFAKKLRFSAWESFVVAAFFALHPMRVESVAWVTERKDVLGILFYVLCLKRYWQYLESNSKKDFAISLLFGFLSVLTKSMAVSLPWTLLLLDWYHQRKWNKYIILDKIPFALVIFPIAAITFFSLAPHPHVKTHSLLVGVWSLTWYLGKFLFPYNLMPIYGSPFPVEIFNIEYFKALIILLAFGYCLWRWRKNRLFVFACLFWVATIFMFWRFDFTDKNIVADRFMYLPCLGITLWLGRYLSRIKWLSIGILLLFGFMSFKQCAAWHDDKSIWSWVVDRDPKVLLGKYNYDFMSYGHTRNDVSFDKLTEEIDRSPNNEQAYITRAEALLAVRNPFLAISDINQAIRINPRSIKALILRGQMYTMQMKYKEALTDFDRVLEMDPRNDYVYLQKASVLLFMENKDEALVYFSKALDINPHLLAVYNQRAYLYVNKKEHLKAIKDFTVLIEAGFELTNSYYMRGKCYEALKQHDKAIEDLNKSLSWDPYDVKILDDLAALYLKNNNRDKALELFNRSTKLHPYSDNAYFARASLFFKEKEYKLAIEDCKKVIELSSNPYPALIMLGDIYLAQGDEALALKQYNRAKLLLKEALKL